MQIVATPRQSFKHYSMWLGIAVGSFPALIALIETFGQVDLLSSTAVLAITSVLGFLIVPAKLIKQHLEVTHDQKTEMIEDVASTPMKPGEDNISVSIDGIRIKPN